VTAEVKEQLLKIIRNIKGRWAVFSLDKLEWRDKVTENKTVDNYEVAINSNYVKIKKYIGKEENVIVPSKIGEQLVTCIDKNAFSNKQQMLSIEFPNRLQNIRHYAFHKCNGLTNITLPMSLRRIERCAFSSCKNLREVTLGDSVTDIGVRAFAECENLERINIPSSVGNIGDGAFSNCDRLTIHGEMDSYARIYANNNGIKFADINLPIIIMSEPEEETVVEELIEIDLEEAQTVDEPEVAEEIEEAVETVEEIEILEELETTDEADDSMFAEIEAIIEAAGREELFIEEPETIAGYDMEEATKEEIEEATEETQSEEAEEIIEEIEILAEDMPEQEASETQTMVSEIEALIGTMLPEKMPEEKIFEEEMPEEEMMIEISEEMTIELSGAETMVAEIEALMEAMKPEEETPIVTVKLSGTETMVAEIETLIDTMKPEKILEEAPTADKDAEDAKNQDTNSPKKYKVKISRSSRRIKFK